MRVYRLGRVEGRLAEIDVFFTSHNHGEEVHLHVLAVGIFHPALAIINLGVFTSLLAAKESYWIFSKEGDDFDLKVSDPAHPSYLLFANDPEMESIIGALNALILNRQLRFTVR